MPHLRQLVEIESRQSMTSGPKPISRTSAILCAISLPLALAALVFLPAGRIDWISGWIFVAVFVAAFALLARVSISDGGVPGDDLERCLWSVIREAQCDMSTGAVIVRNMLRVTPPRTNSRKREWP
jgi:hypothetical protein